MVTDRHGLTARDRLALDAAKLYYAVGLSQQEVADALHVSRPNVSKLVATARAKGFVRTAVVDPRETDAALIEVVRERFGLADVRLVVPVSRGPMGLHHALGDAAADLVGSLAGPGDVVGFWWSDTLQAVLRSMIRLRLRHRALVQLNGTDPGTRVDTILAAFAESAATPVHLCPHPILHSSLEARLDTAGDGPARDLLALQSECDVAVFSADVPRASDLFDSPVVTDEERAQIDLAAVGQICGRFIDGDGKVVVPSLNQRTLGPTLSDLRKIKRTVVVGSGDAALPVIRAAVTSRYATHLVTDVDTAVALAE